MGIKPLETNSIPFGAQYYRAPTPPPEDWERDLDQFQAAGFNTLKFWVQWRWNHPREKVFNFDDLDALMELAAERGLKVALNIICDVAPAWLFQKMECRMLTADGRRVGPVATACRQIGGAPGPCLNHPEARRYRMAFIEAAGKRFAHHPALAFWDSWNEPEFTVAILREPLVQNQVCYCEHCRQRFQKWLENRYVTLEKVNQRWGRNYQSWQELELPVWPSVYGDSMDWRLFQVSVLSEEQKNRVEEIRRVDPIHPIGCHTVPMPVFNPVSCGSDEWPLHAPGDWVGNSLGSDPFSADLIVNAGRGKPAINAEIHAMPGSSLSRPHPLKPRDCRRYILAPLAHNIKGFLFWQYRPERLGVESPAWGMTRPDGASTPWLEELSRINRQLQKKAEFIHRAQPLLPEIGLLYHPANHIFDWCAEGSFDLHDRAVRGAYETLYKAGYRTRFVHPSDFKSKAGLKDLKALIYPFPYALDEDTAQLLKQWVAQGGQLLGEAFFGNLNLDNNRHSPVVPGLGFEKVFGAREGIATPYSASIDFYSGEQNVETADYRSRITLLEKLGGLPAAFQCGGYLTKTPLELDGARCLARFEDQSPALAVQEYGEGRAWLCGTCLSAAAGFDSDAQALLTALFKTALPAELPRLEPDAPGVRVDVLGDGEEYLVVAHNFGQLAIKTAVQVPQLPPESLWHNLLTEESLAPQSPGKWWLDLAGEDTQAWTVSITK